MNKQTFWQEMATQAGAEIVQLTDGRWMVSSPEGAAKPVACVWKNPETAAQLYCCKAELIQPIA